MELRRVSVEPRGRGLEGIFLLTLRGSSVVSVQASATSAPRQAEICSETEKRVPLQMQIENFGTLMTQVSFVNYDGGRMDVP